MWAPPAAHTEHERGIVQVAVFNTPCKRNHKQNGNNAPLLQNLNLKRVSVVTLGTDVVRAMSHCCRFMLCHTAVGSCYVTLL